MIRAYLKSKKRRIPTDVVKFMPGDKYGKQTI